MRIINKLIFFVILLLYVSFTLQVNSNTLNINIEEYTSNKKFKFLFVKNCDLPKVSLNISFKNSGYAYDNNEKLGLSWFTSLIIQEGSGKNNAEDFAKKLENKGIDLNFISELETFRISVNVLSENLEDAISLLSDAIINPKIDKDGLIRVSEKIKNIFSNLENDSYFIAQKEMKNLLFKDHPYSKIRYGNINTITNIKKNDILSYIKHNFTKDNIYISVVGCTTKEEIATLLDKYLSKLTPKRSKVEEISIKNDFGDAKNKNVVVDKSQSVIIFAQRGILYKDPDYYSAILLINALGGMGLNSILMKELRKNLGITYDISANIISEKHGSIIAGIISTDSSTANKSILAIKEIFNKVKEVGINEQLFKDTKITLLNNFIFLLSNNINIVVLLNDIQINNHNVNYINDYIYKITKIKLEDVNRLANSLLDSKNLFFIEVGRCL